MTVTNRYTFIFGIGMVFWSIVWFFFYDNEQSFGVSLMIGISSLVASILIDIQDEEYG